MMINYWDCKYKDYDEFWNGEEENRVYGCTHPKGRYVCRLDNKWGNDEAECDIAEID